MTILMNLEWAMVLYVFDGDDNDDDGDNDNYFEGDHNDDEDYDPSWLHCGIEIGTPCQGLQAPFSRPDQRILESSAHDHHLDDDIDDNLFRLCDM